MRCFFLLIDTRIYTYYNLRKAINENKRTAKTIKEKCCSLIRHGSNHDIWYSSVTGKQFAVPRHKKEIKTGTAIAILRDAGMDS